MSAATCITCAGCGVRVPRRSGAQRYCDACAVVRARASYTRWQVANRTAHQAARAAYQAEQDARAPLVRILSCRPACGRAGFDVAFQRLSDGSEDVAFVALGTAGAEQIRVKRQLRLRLNGDEITEVTE